MKAWIEILTRIRVGGINRPVKFSFFPFVSEIEKFLDWTKMRATVSVSQKLKTLHKQILLKVEREREKGEGNLRSKYENVEK